MQNSCVLKRIRTLLENPKVLIIKWIRLLEPIVSDELYLRMLFRVRVGYWPNLKNPQSYNEKIQWLKLYYRRPEYTRLVDKVSVKEFVCQTIGEQYVIPTLGVWDDVDEIAWEALPNQFVVKASHDSGGIVICKDKSKLDIKNAKTMLESAGSKDYTKYNKEYVYHNVPHRFIAEEYMEDESGFELKDYKIFCFDGVPKYLYVASGRQKHDARFDFYDCEFNHLPVLNGHPNADVWPKKPRNFEEMLDVAAKLSEGLPEVRVDLYNINGRVYFGEMTFFHWSGMAPYDPQEWDYKFGEMIKLPNV